MSAGAGAAAAAAAAAHQAKLREEEERLTTYTQHDLNGWEFKIVRSAGKINGDKFSQLCEEESKNGWELVEKFDDNRVRFKRRVECREQDGYAEIDPYRTHFGMSELKLVFIILGVVFTITGMIIAFAISTGR
jgi:hypothetical protein